MIRVILDLKEKTRIEEQLTPEEIDEINQNLVQAESEQLLKEYITKRNQDRGSVESQLEFIVENGIDAFIERDNAIRLKYPKPKKQKV